LEGEVSRFDVAAKTWDEKPSRVENARKVGEAIVNFLPVKRSWRVLEVGAGTGLLTLYLEPYVGELVAVDSSRGMVEVLKEKLERLGVTTVKPLLMDAERELPDGPFELSVIHMTLHHIKEPALLLKRIEDRLSPGGFVAVGELLKEDGTFHKSNEGVYHFGFSREELFKYFEEAGLEPYLFKVVHSIERNGREYPIFLAVARAPVR
jgi:ubiquinone/menaquinone biosynthesis C-methylase UbiE